MARIRSIDRVTWLDPDTCCSPTTFEAATLAAGTAIDAVARGGFALVRPPGHHALPDRAMALCLFCNAAIAARHAQQELGLGRVAIIDWDAHHGNGTQTIVGSDPSILYVSLHQYGGGFFPGTGGPDDQGETILNVPLAAGSGDAEYVAAFREVVEPAVTKFEPDLLVVSAGFDAHRDDPTSAMQLTAGGFRQIAARCAAIAPRVAAVLEGGYNLRTLPVLVEAAMEGFSA